MKRFNLKKLNEVDRKEKYRVCSLKLWKILTLRWKLIVLGKRLERMSKFVQRESRLFLTGVMVP
jgi:hypothetical protein